MAELLVRYGKSAFVGRFAGDGGELTRGTAVVVRTPRGLEVGEVLGPAARFAAQVDAAAGGELLRELTPDDEIARDRATALGHAVLDAADRGGLPATFLDCEVTLDARGAVLHAVAWEACDLDPLLAELSDRFGLAVRLMDVSRTPTLADPPEPTANCGSGGCGTDGGCSTGGCGTESGGCSTGSCSKGAVKSADELTAYFADLRRQMEATRLPLN